MMKHYKTAREEDFDLLPLLFYNNPFHQSKKNITLL